MRRDITNNQDVESHYNYFTIVSHRSCHLHLFTFFSIFITHNATQRFEDCMFSSSDELKLTSNQIKHHRSGTSPVTWRSWIRASWYIYENNQQDALYRLIYYSKSALHVSGDVFAHHQEHLSVFTVPVSVHPSCCRLVPAATWVNTTRYCKYRQVLLMMGENIARNM